MNRKYARYATERAAPTPRKAPFVNSRSRIREIATRYVPGPSWAEFGVREGKSARHLLHLLPEDGELHLYDSWEGLPEEWIRSPEETIPKGHFACDIPKFDDARVSIHAGWFSETLKAPQPAFDFVHLDCDLYSSTKDVLDKIVLNPKAIVIMDDMLGYYFHGMHQARAWYEFLKATGLKADYIAQAKNGQVAARMQG